ncbi:MAG: PLDc N-terminal domain-containing protein [Haliscomenobacter sp.]|uniref:PLDc N-terminal domain-containing protein n=1 Tax=Haliscomenobacter sp. TaxID=2717303 RepID=UPI0029B05293|nr:PLDc N-terminal domain-containing protein [Haliscomenobacter sp.]MDX2068411.1 PLDc N-terminal domain-containing protein [Haliscomenobacter sp.]
MYGYYTPILLLQAFCLYHAYRNNTHQKWLWLIIFIPLIGCLIYLYDNFASRRNLEDVQEGVKNLVNSNYQINKLEKEIKYAPTITNKVKLADAYVQHQRFAEAIPLYQSCLQGLYADDPHLIKKLLRVLYLNKDYAAAIECGQKLLQEKSFQHDEARIAYAWSCFYAGKVEEAEVNFSAMDLQFTNFPHRVEFYKFLIEIKRVDEAKEKLETLMDEIDHMSAFEQKLKRPILRQIKQMHGGLKA